MWRSWFKRCCTSILILAIFCQKHKILPILTKVLFTMWLAVAAHIWWTPPMVAAFNSSVRLGFSVTALTDSFIGEVDGSWAGTETSVSFPRMSWCGPLFDRSEVYFMLASSSLVPLVMFLFQWAWDAGGLDPVTFGGTVLGVKWFLQCKKMLKLLRKEEEVVCPVTSFILSK